MSIETAGVPSQDAGVDAVDDGLTLLDLLIPLAESLWTLILVPIVIGLLALGVTFLIPPTFTARTSFLPPQQQQSSAASALASLGALAGLGGAAGGVKNPVDQYVALMRSHIVSDRIIDAFELMLVYREKFRVDTRKELDKNVRITAGKKDGLVVIEVDDDDPKRAAAMANRYVSELQVLTSTLAITEAQQRRVFFERQLEQTRDRLASAQKSLESGGFNAGAIKAEPKAAAEGYARVNAQVTAAEVRLQALRRAFADNTPEVQQQLATLGALRAQLTGLEARAAPQGDADYITRYREFKYQETLFDLFARQYELARADESREGALIQVVDAAAPPEKKSRPRRLLIALGVWIGSLLAISIWVLARSRWHESVRNPFVAHKANRLRRALRLR
jgi:uncharacterized protein involved in exopolysaccharide biosynthesis